MGAKEGWGWRGKGVGGQIEKFRALPSVSQLCEMTL